MCIAFDQALALASLVVSLVELLLVLHQRKNKN